MAHRGPDVARDDGGQAIVELALTLPVLMLLAALLVTLSLLGLARLATENGASEAARIVSLTNSEERARVAAIAAISPLSPDRLAMTVDSERSVDRSRGSIVSVTLRYRLDVPFAFVGIDHLDVGAFAARMMEYEQ